MAYPIVSAMPGHSGDRATLGQLRLRGGCRRPKRDADPPDFGCQPRGRSQLPGFPASSRPRSLETMVVLGDDIKAAGGKPQVPITLYQPKNGEAVLLDGRNRL